MTQNELSIVELETFKETTCYPSEVEPMTELCVAGRLSKPITAHFEFSNDGKGPVMVGKEGGDPYDFYGFKVISMIITLNDMHECIWILRTLVKVIVEDQFGAMTTRDEPLW